MISFLKIGEQDGTITGKGKMVICDMDHPDSIEEFITNIERSREIRNSI